ncbi:MAG: hypothetical protein ACPGWR_24390 [Ardenticatenaceae bacterium]
MLRPGGTRPNPNEQAGMLVLPKNEQAGMLVLPRMKRSFAMLRRGEGSCG